MGGGRLWQWHPGVLTLLVALRSCNDFFWREDLLRKNGDQVEGA